MGFGKYFKGREDSSGHPAEVRASHTQETDTITQSFSAERLLLDIYTADVSVEPSSASDMEVVVTGPKKRVDAIKLGMRGNALAVTEEGVGSDISIARLGSVTSIRSSGSVVIQGLTIKGSTVIGGTTDTDPPAKIVIKVPSGTPIEAGRAGNIRIGDVDGPLKARMATSGELTAGITKDVDLEASTSGRIRVTRVIGLASLESSTAGTIVIDAGEVSHLDASATTSGSINANVHCRSASLSASTAGDVRVAHVVEQPRRRTSTSGRVDVGSTG